jgi:hypothetical protein
MAMSRLDSKVDPQYLYTDDTPIQPTRGQVLVGLRSKTSLDAVAGETPPGETVNDLSLREKIEIG